MDIDTGFIAIIITVAVILVVTVLVVSFFSARGCCRKIERTMEEYSERETPVKINNR